MESQPAQLPLGDHALAKPGDFTAAVRLCLPPIMGLLPMGLAFGVAVAQSPLAWWWAPVFSTVIFAGSLEFILLGLVVAVAPLATIALTAFLVNFRHVFYALSFPMRRVHGIGAKIYSTFTLTDSAWALTTSQAAQTWSRRRILTIQACFQITWAGSVTIGALGGSFIPESVVGLNFALTAFFLVLCIDMCRNRKNVPVPFVALGSAVVGNLFFSDGMLVAAMILFVTFLLARYAALKMVNRRA